MFAPVFMVDVKPFAAIRPRPDLAAQICELPYDVLSSEEARQAAQGNPLSFFHVSKPEIDLARGTDLYSPVVYAKAKENFDRLIASGLLRQDPQASFYLYRQVMGAHSQFGLVGVASCQAYLRNQIKKHELTRPDKEADRVRHIEILNCQTGPAFLTYRAEPGIDRLILEIAAEPPDIDFTAKDTVRHSSWTIRQPDSVRFLETAFAKVPVLYIADGHHRTAAAARVFQVRHGAGHSAHFLAVIFPHNQLQILPYNRVLKDLNRRTPAQLVEELQTIFVSKPNGRPNPRRKHELGLYLAGQWHTLQFRPEILRGEDPLELLDARLLQARVLRPIFGIDDPRTSQRIHFVGGIRGAAELERLVDNGQYACGFSLFPTRIEDLMAIADHGGIMPPKSTWFEPKLRDAMFCHLL